MKVVIFTHVLYLILIKTFTVTGVPKCESKVELRAVMLSCPVKDSGCDDDDPLTQAMKSEEYQILHPNSNNFEAWMEKKNGDEVKDCKRKLIISLKIKNVGKIPCDDEYIVVDHVFDPVTGGRGRLLSPVVLKIRQEQMIQLYELKFQRVVNSDPFEEQKANGNTCSVDPENPTCGIAMYDGRPIPFSEGFCCSSDPHVNEKRQLSSESGGNPFLYQNSELISPSKFRLVREEKSRAIVNPGLVKLKSGNSEEMYDDKRASDCGVMSDTIKWDKIPNYLLEHDRKIICDKGDFMKELCRLREEKMAAEEPTAEKSKKKTSDKLRNVSKKSSPLAEFVALENGKFSRNGIDEDLASDSRVDNMLIYKHFKEGLKVNQTASSVPVPGRSDFSNASRGKRENRESKKFNLEEKLDRFTKSKKQSINRRKRLLELTHRRFRKAGNGCVVIPETQRFLTTDCSNSCPPRYFFSHDRAIIDPLEIKMEVANSTSRSPLREHLQDEKIKHMKCRAPDKGDFFGKKKVVDRSFYRRQWMNGNKLKDNTGNKKEKLNRQEGDKIEKLEKDKELKAENEKEPLMEIAPQSIIGLNKFKGPLKVKGEGETAELTRSYEWGGKEEVKAQERYCNEMVTTAKSSPKLKNFLHKNEVHKRLIKPKIKNTFLCRNREQQKLVRGDKQTDLSYGVFFDSRKSKEPSLTGYSKTENELLHGRKLESGRARVKENLKELKFPKVAKLHQFTEKPDLDVISLDKEIIGKKNHYNEEKSCIRKPEKRKKLQEGASHFQQNMDANVNFDLEIIRNHNPTLSQEAFYPCPFGKPLKNRFGANPLKGLSTNIYNLQRLRNDQDSFPFRDPSHRHYILENEELLPRDVIQESSTSGHFTETGNSPLFQGFLEKLMNEVQPNRNSNIFRKLERRKSVVEHDEKDDDFEMSRRPFAWEEYRLPSGSSTPIKRHLQECKLLKEDKSRKESGSLSKEEARRQSDGKIIKKRSTPYSFQPVPVIRGSDLHLPELESNFASIMMTKKGIDSCAFNISRVDQENLNFDWSTLSGLRDLLNAFHLRTAKNEEKSSRSISDRLRLIRSYMNAPDYVLEEVESSLKGKRQTNEETKKNSSKQDKAHCMRFGDMWYSMYSIKQPVVSQIAGVQLFNKHSAFDGTSKWRDLTKGKMIRVGTFLTKAEDELPSISITFVGKNPKKSESAIDTDNYYLLVPSHVTDPSKVNSYPQFEGGPAEYMLVQSKDVSSGGECNRIGTSFEAFARQSDRCSQRQGSCLKRQPVDLWREDMEARIKGKRGKYFVENFGNVPNSSIKTYSNITGEFLALEYYGEYASTIEIEVKADFNAIVRKGQVYSATLYRSSAQIPIVYVDSTYPKKTRIILSVLNIGLTSSYFRPRLGNCPPGFNPAWCPLEGPLVAIPPQQRHDFKLDLTGTLPSGKSFLTVEILNQINKPVALRKIILKRGDRCICAFHCKCSCVGSAADDRVCSRLNLEEYRKAGYLGSYPFRGGALVSVHESLLENIHIVFFTALYILLLLGVMKGILGIFCRRIGITGVRIITGPKELCKYYECELLGCSVLYDEFGFPVHPTTCQPVQIVPLWLEMLINFLFFFIYPIRGICFLLSALPCCKAFSGGVCTHNDEGECDRKSSSPLLKQPNVSSIYYNLTTVDSKKSKQECLPCAAYNGDDDPLEEDDTEFVLQEMQRYRKK